jgi:carbon storage regulator
MLWTGYQEPSAVFVNLSCLDKLANDYFIDFAISPADFEHSDFVVYRLHRMSRKVFVHPLHGGLNMLVLSRRPGEEIIINSNIRVTVVSVKGDRVRIGIDAPPDITVDRAEIHARRLEFQEVPVAVPDQDDEVVAIGVAQRRPNADDTMSH